MPQQLPGRSRSTDRVDLSWPEKTDNRIHERTQKWLGRIKHHAYFISLPHENITRTTATSRSSSLPARSHVILQGDLAKCSIFREEALEAITEGLDCTLCNEKVQEQSARALMMLAGRFSHSGEAIAERWLLQQSGFQENVDSVFSGKDTVLDSGKNWDEDEEESKSWLSNAATALLSNRNTRFLIALSNSIANGIPVLARASLVTFSWLSSFLHLIEDEDLRSMLCSLFIPRMLRSIDYGNALEERVLASLSLLNLSKSSGGLDLVPLLNEEAMSQLRNLSLVTWTADELISIITSSSKHQKDFVVEKKVNFNWH